MIDGNAMVELHSFEIPPDEAADILSQSRGGRPRASKGVLDGLMIPYDQLSPEQVEAINDIWRSEEPVPLPKDPRRSAVLVWHYWANICQLCGLRVDIALLPPHPGAASVDHIDGMSWSTGFKPERHTYDNARLTHLHCNLTRMDADPGLIAVRDMRDEFLRAVAMYEKTGRRPQTLPWLRHRVLGLFLEGVPFETPAYKHERTHQPIKRYGKEWVLP